MTVVDTYYTTLPGLIKSIINDDTWLNTYTFFTYDVPSGIVMETVTNLKGAITIDFDQGAGQSRNVISAAFGDSVHTIMFRVIITVTIMKNDRDIYSDINEAVDMLIKSDLGRIERQLFKIQNQQFNSASTDTPTWSAEFGVVSSRWGHINPDDNQTGQWRVGEVILEGALTPGIQ